MLAQNACALLTGQVQAVLLGELLLEEKEKQVECHARAPESCAMTTNFEEASGIAEVTGTLSLS